MVRIRKKTSKRVTTHMREKIKHKVSEAHKKAKKAAKKDPTWKSKQKKDPGIPSLFPYKQEILQEVQDARNKKEAEKLARKEKGKSTLAEDIAESVAQAQAASMQDDEMQDEDTDDAQSDLEQDASNLKTYARSLRSVIASSDILIQILDARDPQGTRTISLEKEILSNTTEHTAKKLVFVLNKVDLVPKENVEAWLQYYRRSFPTLGFRSSTQNQRNNLSVSSSGGAGGGSGVQALLTLLKSYARGTAKSLTVGVIGLPNVGKSSLINTLKRSKACSVAPTPGWTKEIQQITLDGGLKILDCPGVVLDDPSSSSQDITLAQKVLRNAVNIDKLDDPLTPVELILTKCKKEHLMIMYNIPAFSTTQEFLVHVARARGRIRKGGLPDIAGTARSVIRDWCAGRIRYYTVPPSEPMPLHADGSTSLRVSNTAADSDKIVAELAPEFDLDALFKQADSEALGTLQDAKALKGVAMAEGMGSTSASDAVPRLLGEEDEQMSAPESSKAPSKRKAVEEPEVVTVAPKQKTVTFATSQMTCMFDKDEMLPIGQNKAIKTAAKKDKRKKAKLAQSSGTEMDTAETSITAAEEEDVMDSLGLEARTGALSFEADDTTEGDVADEPYDFRSFFGMSAPGKLKLDQSA